MGDVGALGRVLVTGATGFLGGALVRHLRGLGCDVTGMGRDVAKLKTLGGDCFAHDLAKPVIAEDLPNIDAIVHCAALSAPFGKRADFQRANVDATRHMIALAQAKSVRRFVHISTPSVYFAFRDQVDVGEDYALPPPVNHYAATKAQAEHEVRAALPDCAVILRPRGIYGAGDTALLPRLLMAAEKRPLPRLRGGVASIDLTHVDDVVGAIMAALRAPDAACGEVFNVSSGQALAIRDIVTQVCARARVQARWRDVPLPVALGAARVIETIAALRPSAPEPLVTRYGLGLFAYRQSLDISKASKGLGWVPQVTFETGLQRTFESRP